MLIGIRSEGTLTPVPQLHAVFFLNRLTQKNPDLLDPGFSNQ
jgi:hypothetical protein